MLQVQLANWMDWMDLQILFHSLWFPPYTWGGVGTQTYDLVHALARQGVQVTVCCGGPSTFDNELTENLEIIRLPTIEAPPRFLWFQLRNRNARILEEKLKKSDLLHSQATSFSLYPFLMRKQKRPWIVSLHVSPFEELRVLLSTSPWKWNLEDVTTHILAFPVWTSFNMLELNGADGYVFCGNATARKIKERFHYAENKAHVIQNGIDFQKIERILKASNSTNNSGQPTLFYCGRLYWRKGIEYLIRAMPYIVKEQKNVILKVFGKGPLRSRVASLISALHLENNVRLLGYADYDVLIRELKAADVAVFPSLYEGLSVAMLEAMACSKPIVAFDYPFTREIVKNMENGILVTPKDTLELSKAISFLLSDDKARKRIGNSACQYVRKNHDWNVIVQKYLKTYTYILRDFNSKDA